MKHTLLPFLFLSSAAFGHPNQILITHPQADVNYYCQPGYNLQQCINIACSYATPYSCRVIAQNQNQYFIETFIPPGYASPVVILPPPVFYPPPVIYIPPLIQPVISITPQRNCPPRSQYNYRHRPSRR